MRARNWGRIVFVSSESGVQIPSEMIHYGMTKTAQLAVARGLAETLAGTGVTVNSVLPGPTASEGVGDFMVKLAQGKGVDLATMETGVLRDRAAVVADSTLRHPRRSGGHDHLRLQRPRLGDHRRGLAGRWRGDSRCGV